MKSCALARAPPSHQPQLNTSPFPVSLSLARAGANDDKAGLDPRPRDGDGKTLKAPRVPPTLVTPHQGAPADATWQGLTLVHHSAQLEPCLSQENTLNTS